MNQRNSSKEIFAEENQTTLETEMSRDITIIQLVVTTESICLPSKPSTKIKRDIQKKECMADTTSVLPVQKNKDHSILRKEIATEEKLLIPDSIHPNHQLSINTAVTSQEATLATMTIDTG